MRVAEDLYVLGCSLVAFSGRRIPSLFSAGVGFYGILFLLVGF